MNTHHEALKERLGVKLSIREIDCFNQLEKLRECIRAVFEEEKQNGDEDYRNIQKAFKEKVEQLKEEKHKNLLEELETALDNSEL